MAHGQDEPNPGPDETHLSPDGALTLTVSYGDNPWLGFAGGDWHVHRSREEIAQLAADILADKVSIDVRWMKGERTSVCALLDEEDDYLERARRYQLPGERIELRKWSR